MDKSFISVQGFTLLEAVVVATLLSLCVAGPLMAYGRVAKATRLTAQKIVAEDYAAELLETFMSFTSPQLKAYLSSTPYLLCSHANILDRIRSQTVNPDPIADLPNTGMHSIDQLSIPNRFYMVWVVNIESPGSANFINYSDCDHPASAISLQPNERFLVSVGLSWIPTGTTDVTQAQTVVLSTILSDGP